MKYRNNILSFNYWEVDSNGKEKKWEYACRPDDKDAILCSLEKRKQAGEIVDYEMYGQANFSNPISNINFGDTIYIKKAETQRKLFNGIKFKNPMN